MQATTLDAEPCKPFQCYVLNNSRQSECEDIRTVSSGLGTLDGLSTALTDVPARFSTLLLRLRETRHICIPGDHSAF